MIFMLHLLRRRGTLTALQPASESWWVPANITIYSRYVCVCVWSHLINSNVFIWNSFISCRKISYSTGKREKSHDWPDHIHQQWGTVWGRNIFHNDVTLISLHKYINLHSYLNPLLCFLQQMSDILPKRETDKKKITDMSQVVQAFEVLLSLSQHLHGWLNPFSKYLEL